MKRILYISGALVTGLILVIGILLVVVTSDKMGTALAQRVVEEFSRTMGANARIGSVAYQFPARLTLRDIYRGPAAGYSLVYAGIVCAFQSIGVAL